MNNVHEHIVEELAAQLQIASSDDAHGHSTNMYAYIVHSYMFAYTFIYVI